jgi:hypothetical protein
MRNRYRLLAGVLAGGLLLSACGDEDATEEGLVRSLTSLGSDGQAAVTTEQAQCIADTLFGQFDEEQISQIADASSPAELPPGAEQAITDAYDGCVEPAAG